MSVPTAEDGRVTIESWLSEWDDRSLARDVLNGLTASPKDVPPKHFYDTRGSELFEQICALPEYYPTRAETSILISRSDEIVAFGAGELVELGSGAATKARLLLSAMERAGNLRRYIPIDVSEQVVRSAGDALVNDFAGLLVHGVIGDFERHLERVPRQLPDTPRIVALLGGTVGNFKPDARRELLRGMASLMNSHDRLLLGTDLVKDVAVLEAAYNDAAGVTPEFNKNVLHVINRELDADFDVSAFEHVAFFDHENEWIDIRLRALRAMTVNVRSLDLSVHFDEGEDLRTEISAKFTPARVNDEFAAAGLIVDYELVDDEGRFALWLARTR